MDVVMTFDYMFLDNSWFMHSTSKKMSFSMFENVGRGLNVSIDYFMPQFICIPYWDACTVSHLFVVFYFGEIAWGYFWTVAVEDSWNHQCSLPWLSVVIWNLCYCRSYTYLFKGFIWSNHITARKVANSVDSIDSEIARIFVGGVSKLNDMVLEKGRAIAV